MLQRLSGPLSVTWPCHTIPTRSPKQLLLYSPSFSYGNFLPSWHERKGTCRSQFSLLWLLGWQRREEIRRLQGSPILFQGNGSKKWRFLFYPLSYSSSVFGYDKLELNMNEKIMFPVLNSSSRILPADLPWRWTFFPCLSNSPASCLPNWTKCDSW